MITKEMIEKRKRLLRKTFAMDHSLKTNAQNLLWEFNNTRPDESENALVFTKNCLELVVL